MNDESLRRAWRELPVPSPSESARARAKHRALLALQSPTGEEPRPEMRAFWRRARPIFWSFVLGLIVSAVALWPRDKAENLSEDRQLLRQVEQMFPQRLNAVVQAGNQVNLSISDNNQVGNDQPVLLIFKRQNDLIRVLSFSGHHVCVPLKGGETCFDVLESSDGGIILAGETSVLEPGHLTVAGYTVSAERFSL